MNASPAVMAAQYATTGAGVLVAAWYVWRVRRGGEPLGPRPKGELPRTGRPFLIALPAWLFLGALFIVGFGLRGATANTADAVAHAVVGICLLSCVTSGERAPTLTGRRLVLTGLLAGIVTFGFVVLVSEAIAVACRLGGVPLPTQDVIEVVARSRGWERVGIMVGAGLLAPFAEEILFRGALLPALAQAVPVRRAIWLQALVFGLIHVIGRPYAMWPLAIPLALIGAICGWLYVRTASLSVAILVHTVFNVLNLTLLALASA